ncbi:hypothetical protein TNCV_2068131 [Trichonephila clavipes]|uniref:Uncharacterized protein n=1 Tax=Trichonephila clavipes TaxID=2585209 RepID=A0A8X6W360_TRICX|nr:hypothetical protein TNCV_2068131 [Trichonephila clavipes]
MLENLPALAVETEEREIVLNRRPELERKISMRSTKDQLIKKTFLCLFSSGIHGKEKKGRTAADSVQSGWPIVAAKAKQSSRAGAANENRNCKNFKTLEKKQKRGRNTGCASSELLPSALSNRQTYLLK